MKGLPTLIRLRKWELEEKRRKLIDLRMLRQKLTDALARLEDDIEIERGVAVRTAEVQHAYGPYIAVSVDRRRTLEASAEDVDHQIQTATDELHQSFQELKKYEIAQGNRQRRVKDESNRREQIMLDDIAIETYRRQ